MRAFKKIVAFLIIIVLRIAVWIVDLIIKAECWVAGVGFLLLAILVILAVVKKQWLQVCVIVGLSGIVVIILFLSVNIQVWIKDGIERLT